MSSNLMLETEMWLIELTTIICIMLLYIYLEGFKAGGANWPMGSRWPAKSVYATGKSFRSAPSIVWSQYE